MCRCRTVSVQSLALSIAISNRFQVWSQARSWLLRSSAKFPALAIARPASCRLSEIARSREV